MSGWRRRPSSRRQRLPARRSSSAAAPAPGALALGTLAAVLVAYVATAAAIGGFELLVDAEDPFHILVRFALFLLIPLGSWLGGAVVERVVDLVLD